LDASPEPRLLLSDWVDQDVCFPPGGRLELWPTDCGRDLVEKLSVLVVEVDRLRALGLASRSLLTAEILDWLALGEAPTDWVVPQLRGEAPVLLRPRLRPARGMVLSLPTGIRELMEDRLSALSSDRHS
jgi:hypothetical protein